MQPAVYITFDVECSMGGAWGNDDRRPVPPGRGMMGQFGRRALGVPRLCEILADSGLRATFFLEPFNDELGHPGQTAPVVDHLLGAGQDVQLHVHPNHKSYGLAEQGLPYRMEDDIGRLDPQEQQALIEEGAQRLAGYTGRRPRAFRAGNMGASEQTLEALARAGIRIDSSYCFAFLGGQCLFADGQRYNGSKRYGEVVEVALSAFEQPTLGLLHPAKPVDLVGISFEEAAEATEKILAAGGDVVMILHSFSLFKVRNVQYDGGRPNRIVTRRFERYCRWLARTGKAVRTFDDLADDVEAGRYEPRAVAPCRLNRPLRALARKAVQGVNNLYWT